MSVEKVGIPEQPNIKLCPYWRKVVVYGGRILALCGRDLDEPLPISDTDLGPRLEECIYGYDALTAYWNPGIILVTGEGRTRGLWVNFLTHGADAITELESQWDQYVEKFHNGEI